MSAGAHPLPGGEEIARAVTEHACGFFEDMAPAAATVTFLGNEPITVLRFGPDSDDLVQYLSVGTSRHPMTDPGELLVDEQNGPRAETVITLRGGVDEVFRSLAVIASTPAVEGVILQADALIDLGQPLWKGSAFTGVMLEAADLPPLVWHPEQEPIEFLRAVPLTHTEAAWVRVKGAQALREAWVDAGVDVADPFRKAVSL